MLGFPTETPEEIKNTINFAVSSDITLAYFFFVTPQPGTPMYDLAIQENPEITKKLGEIDAARYRQNSWYEHAYQYPLTKLTRYASLRFYLSPKRAVRILKHLGYRNFWRSFVGFVQIFLK